MYVMCVCVCMLCVYGCMLCVYACMLCVYVCMYARRYGLFFDAGSHSDLNAGRRMVLYSE